MAVAVVQKYLDLAISLFVGNKSGTDNFFRLPDDWRKLTGMKVANIQLDTYTQSPEIYVAPPGSIISVAKSINKSDLDNSLLLVFFSHPVSIKYVSGTELANKFNTSFYGIYRDRTGKINSPGSSTNWITFDNNLSTSSSYLTAIDAANAGANVDVYIVEIEFE